MPPFHPTEVPQGSNIPNIKIFLKAFKIQTYTTHLKQIKRKYLDKYKHIDRRANKSYWGNLQTKKSVLTDW